MDEQRNGIVVRSGGPRGGPRGGKSALLTMMAAIGGMAICAGDDLALDPVTKLRAKHFHRNLKPESKPLPPNLNNDRPVVKGADRNSPCPCGSGLKAKKCKCEGFVAPGVVPRLDEHTNPADYLPAAHEYTFEEWVAFVNHFNGGQPFPAEYDNALRAYHANGVTMPHDAWEYIRRDMGLNVCCNSCHTPPDTACKNYEQGGNGRCVYCDHAATCHPGPGATCDIGRDEPGAPSSAAEAHHHPGSEFSRAGQAFMGMDYAKDDNVEPRWFVMDASGNLTYLEGGPGDLKAAQNFARQFNVNPNNVKEDKHEPEAKPPS